MEYLGGFYKKGEEKQKLKNPCRNRLHLKD